MHGAARKGMAAFVLCNVAVLLCVAMWSGGLSAYQRDVGVSESDAARLGKRIFRDGVSVMGRPLEAWTGAGTPLRGADAACAACHRRSGLGGSEGGRATRPIGGALFATAQPGPDRELPPVQRVRTPYSASTLARALREGVNETGRRLDTLMPRYRLSAADLAALIAYLRTLGIAPDPGVTETELHLATVIAGDVPTGRCDAMLEVLRAYVGLQNADTRAEGKRAREDTRRGKGMYRGYRRWVLHVWNLQGSERTWPAQLDAHYRAQPVFAVIGGTSAAGWEPVHAFCERNELPCVFPSIDAPVIEERAIYSVYLSKGVVLEAEALAAFLLEQSALHTQGRIVQVYREGGPGVAVARALDAALQRAGLAQAEDVIVQTPAPPDKEFWTRLAGSSVQLVLWLTSDDLVGLKASGAGPHKLRALFASATLGGDALAWLADDLRDKAYLISPYVLPEQRERTLARTLAWLRPRGIADGELRTRAESYLAVTLAADALRHMAGNFSRDYFLERVEHAAANSLSSALFPRISLGPGQRYAAKGCYVVKIPNDPAAVLVPDLARWITP